tara:strand:- start:283 stop:756 length:474 start_codon:yes stop_codon:yes gene_type:complete
MGSFSQRLGQKVKKGLKLGAKIGAVGVGVGLAYMGMKTGEQVQQRVEGAVDDASMIQQQAVNIPAEIRSAGVLDAKREAIQQVENLNRSKNIAQARLTNPELPSLRTQQSSQAQQRRVIREDQEVASAVAQARCRQQHSNPKSFGFKRCVSRAKKNL